MFIKHTVFNVKVTVPEGFFYGRVLLQIVLHNIFNVSVRQIVPTLILHKILDIKPHNDSMKKSLSIFQKLQVLCKSS